MKNSIRGEIFLIVTTNSARDPVMVDLPLLVHLEVVHVGRHQDVVERLDQVEEQPDIDHLYVSRLGKVVADTDEHRSEDQHHSDIQRYHSFKEELLEIVGRMTNNVENHCWSEYSQDNAQKSTAKVYVHTKYFQPPVIDPLEKDLLFYEILSQLQGPRVFQVMS